MENKKPIVKTHHFGQFPLYWIGPDLDEVAKTCLYFSLSGEESLTAPPFCNPAHILLNKGFRVISATLPDHENNERPQNMSVVWGDHPEKLENFFDNMSRAIESISPQCDGPIAALGLSRGGFVATHLAARSKSIQTVIGYAPLTALRGAPEMDLSNLANLVKHKKIHYTIGHNDTLVETPRVITTISSFIDALDPKERASASITLSITPSIGKYGHGTSDATFVEGISWIN